MFASIGRDGFKGRRLLPAVSHTEDGVSELKLWRWMSVLGFLLAFSISCMSGQARALETSPGAEQLKVTQWGAAQGAPADIYKISQSPDGFLWLATSSGLYRFDGVTFEKVPTIPGDRTKSPQIMTVLATRDGSVWAGYYWGGLSVYRNGALHDANHGPPTGTVWKIIQGPDGAIWVATGGIKGLQISKFKDGRWADGGVSLGLHALVLDDMAFANDGSLQVLADKSLAILTPGSRKYKIQPLAREANALLRDREGGLWVLDAKSVTKTPRSSHIEIALNHEISMDYLSGPCAVIDHRGNLFICRADRSLDVLQLQQAQTKASAALLETIPLMGDEPHSLLEDKEGNVWLSTSSGLDEIRVSAIDTYPLRATPPDGTAWLATTPSGKFYFADNNRVRTISRSGDFEDVLVNEQSAGKIKSLCSDGKGGLWVLSKAITHWFKGQTFNVAINPAWTQPSLNGCAVDGVGELWLSVGYNGVFRLHHGAWQRIVADPSHPNMWMNNILADQSGRILVYAARRNLYRLTGTSAEQIGTTSQLGIGVVRTIYIDGKDILLGGDNGIARLEGRRLQVISADHYPWLAALSGIVQSPIGDTWLNGAQGIARVRTHDLLQAFANPNRTIKHELFNYDDGLRGSVSMLGAYEGGLSHDGRVWFESTTALVSIDPKRLHRNLSIPAVVIQSVTANDHTFSADHGLALPAGTTKAQFDYTALSLTVPLRNQFRYRLTGVDKDWVDAGGRRQAFYTNLAPGHYRFEVVAANNDGVWNRTGAKFDFRIRPAVWQTPLFMVSVGLALAALAWVLYSLRLQEMGNRIRLRLEDRGVERERIARELHDTLLQGFQGLTMRLQSVAEQIPATDPTRLLLDQALDRADEVLIEGRDRVKNLRSNEGDGELAFLIEAAAYRLRVDLEVEIKMVVRGDCKSLHPVVCDELLAIANEALFNAFKHAQATRIELSLACEPNHMRMRIADDGVGFDPSVLATISRPGRYGLIGMRERARKLKASLHIGNTADGAEVLVTVPRRVAYASLKQRRSLLPHQLGLES